MPVYNDVRYVSQAIDSILEQTLVDFELIISDNASTDGTQAICEEYARRDARIRYIRQAQNIGAPQNWNAVVHEARGRFFKWASGNDSCAVTMLELCVAALERDSGAALCYGRTELIDEHGASMGIYDEDIEIRDARASRRFAKTRLISMNNAQQGVYRTDMLRRTQLDRLYPGGDLALMAELALHGHFLLLPERLLFRRSGKGSITALRSAAEVHRMCNPRAKGAMKLAVTRLHVDHFASIIRAGVGLREQLAASFNAARQVFWDRSLLLGELRACLRLP